MINPHEIEERLRIAGEAWADKEEAASLLEEMKKPLLYKLALDSKQNTVALKEAEAYASDEYKDHIRSMVQARKEANKARIRYQSGQIWCEMVRTKEASKRAEMKL